MSDASRSTPPSPPLGIGRFESKRAISGILRTLIYLSLAGALTIMAYAAFRGVQDNAVLKSSEDRLLAWHGLIPSVRKRLAPTYVDKDGRLLADPPSDPKNMLDPDTIVLAHYEDTDVDTQLVDWEALQARLAKATGRRVIGQEYWNSADDVAAVKAGKFQVIALHAADTPYIVNNAGFIPVAVLGTEAGANGNRLDIAVSAKSKIQTLGDIRGHTLTCTAPDSVTGYRAAIAVLSQVAGMRPHLDYSMIFSHGQKRSVLGMVGGEFEVAALSDDKLQSMLQNGSIKASDYRIIYRSEVIPRLTIGHLYNLEPDLAAKVTAAVMDFENEGGATDESTSKPMRFFAIDYKKDFEFVRKIDDSFDPRFRKTPKTEPPPTPADGLTKE